jgi:hypothetical protein
VTAGLLLRRALPCPPWCTPDRCDRWDEGPAGDTVVRHSGAVALIEGAHDEFNGVQVVAERYDLSLDAEPAHVRVAVDGHPLTPATLSPAAARRLAAALLSAADQIEQGEGR